MNLNYIIYRYTLIYNSVNITVTSTMCTSETFNLSWKDFMENARESFKSLRQDPDFADVTLVSEDDQQISAHKVILASSSLVFNDLLKINKLSQPLIYLRGVKGKHLTNLVDFIYKGEIVIGQDDLNDFLALSDDLKVKGLTGVSSRRQEYEQEVHDKELEITEHKTNVKTEVFLEEDTTADKDYLPCIDEFSIAYKEVLPETQAISKVDVYETVERSYDENIDSENLESKRNSINYINSMLFRTTDGFTCNTCGKMSTDKSNMNKHVKNMHLKI